MKKNLHEVLPFSLPFRRQWVKRVWLEEGHGGGIKDSIQHESRVQSRAAGRSRVQGGVVEGRSTTNGKVLEGTLRVKVRS